LVRSLPLALGTEAAFAWPAGRVVAFVRDTRTASNGQGRALGARRTGRSARRHGG
jgi:hypothetical protein